MSACTVYDADSGRTYTGLAARALLLQMNAGRALRRAFPVIRRVEHALAVIREVDRALSLAPSRNATTTLTLCYVGTSRDGYWVEAGLEVKDDGLTLVEGWAGGGGSLDGALGSAVDHAALQMEEAE